MKGCYSTLPHVGSQKEMFGDESLNFARKSNVYFLDVQGQDDLLQHCEEQQTENLAFAEIPEPQNQLNLRLQGRANTIIDYFQDNLREFLAKLQNWRRKELHLKASLKSKTAMEKSLIPC